MADNAKMTVSEALGASGSPFRLEVGGESWAFRHFVQKDKSELEKWLFESTVKATREMKDIYGDDYLKVLGNHSEEKAAYKFAWAGELMGEALTKPGGVAKVFSVLATREGDNPRKQEGPDYWLRFVLGPEMLPELGPLYQEIINESLGVKKKPG